MMDRTNFAYNKGLEKGREELREAEEAAWEIGFADGTLKEQARNFARMMRLKKARKRREKELQDKFGGWIDKADVDKIRNDMIDEILREVNGYMEDAICYQNTDSYEMTAIIWKKIESLKEPE